CRRGSPVAKIVRRRAVRLDGPARYHGWRNLASIFSPHVGHSHKHSSDDCGPKAPGLSEPCLVFPGKHIAPGGHTGSNTATPNLSPSFRSLQSRLIHYHPKHTEL